MRRAATVLLLTAVLAGCATTAPNPRAAADSRQAQAFSTYLSARFAAGEHDLDGAARYYGLSLKNDPANTNLLALSFFYSATAGDFNAAGAYASRVVAAAPSDRAARLALAVIAFQHKDYAQARADLAASAKGPFTVLTLSLFDAWAAAAQKDWPQMDKDIAALASEKGAENMAAFHKGLLAEYAGDPVTAEAAYRQALRGGATPRVTDALGRLLERNARRDDALALYRSHEKDRGFAAVVQPGLARLAAGINASRPDPLVVTPADGVAEALFGIAASLTDTASADVSVLYLRMALYLRPDFALARILLADRFEQQKKFADAIAVYATIDPASPYHRMALVQTALDESNRGRNDAAIADLRKLVVSDPTDTESWTALGDAYRAENHDAAAVDAYDHAEKTLGTPAAKDWPLFYSRATVKDHMHDWKGAEADINLALKLSPAQPQLLNYLGYSWIDQGTRIPEALTMLEQARSLRPYDGYIVDSVGWAYFKLGRYEDAAKTLEQAVLLVPGDATINEHLGDALWRAGRHIDARFQWSHALAFGADADAKAAIEQKLKTGLTG